jgi:hypothetical protein
MICYREYQRLFHEWEDGERKLWLNRVGSCCAQTHFPTFPCRKKGGNFKYFDEKSLRAGIALAAAD